MKKYRVTLYYHTCVDVEVELDSTNRADILLFAREKACSPDYNKELLSNLQEDSGPEIQVWNNKIKDYQYV